MTKIKVTGMAIQFDEPNLSGRIYDKRYSISVDGVVINDDGIYVTMEVDANLFKSQKVSCSSRSILS